LHDTVHFEVHGIPAVAIVSSEFVDAAAEQAKALGLDAARCCFVRHPIQDRTDTEMRALADEIIDQVIAALTEPA
jgi:alkanesulfonate monooxygenase SsuD/methylene tetrahydromethanopterin reductase-like flavin-dependent oxidoreductase (luciferase family)